MEQRHTDDDLAAASVQPFRARATEADLDDLRARLAAARLPETETVHPAAPGPRRWDQGVPLADLVDVVDYWRSGASAARIYYESHNSLDPELRVDVPSAITMYPRDIEKYPRPWAEERYRNIIRWNSPDAGGHFPSFEVPEYFVKDLQERTRGSAGCRQDQHYLT